MSDPYVKCLHGQDKLFQSKSIPKTVNPYWDETFEVHIDNPFKPITFQVMHQNLDKNGLFCCIFAQKLHKRTRNMTKIGLKYFTRF